MSNFAILMFIFALLTLLVGLYMFRGNELKIISGRAAYIGLNKSEWKKIGKWTIISSILIFIIGIIGLIFNI